MPTLVPMHYSNVSLLLYAIMCIIIYIERSGQKGREKELPYDYV